MKHLAIDIGAESGRGITGEVLDGKLHIKEVARFVNQPIEVGSGLHWDLEKLKGFVREVVRQNDDSISVGIDTWAVDTVVLDENHQPLFQPFHYRDLRTNGVRNLAFEKMSREDIFRQSGAQFLPFNTLYQWIALMERGTDLQKAKSMVMIPDFLHMNLTGGGPFVEYTNATTTQFTNPVTKVWSDEILDCFGLPKTWLPPILQPGTKIGSSMGVDVIVPASHDTASAVLAVPDLSGNSAWISSGTWSIIGVEVAEAILSIEALESGFANEGGPENFRFSKNVAGLWIIQQCRSTWAEQGREFGYEDLRKLAMVAEPTDSLIDPDDPMFLAPGDMPSRIASFLKATDQESNLTIGQLVMVVLNSLAAKYRFNLDLLRRFAPNRIEQIHMIGGGSQHPLLNQLTADFCEVPVLAGPVEATAIGNLMMQMKTVGTVESIQKGRELVRDSFELKTYLPSQNDRIRSKYERFLALLHS